MSLYRPARLYSLSSERLSDGMAELNQLQDAADLQLATSLLLIYAHKQCKIIGELLTHCRHHVLTSHQTKRLSRN